LQTTYLHESLEDVNSSLAQSDVSYCLGRNALQSGFWRSKILANYWFM